jgi:hypothetical protein
VIPTKSLPVLPVPTTGDNSPVPGLSSDRPGAGEEFYTSLGDITVKAIEGILKDRCTGCGEEFDAETYGIYPSCCR